MRDTIIGGKKTLTEGCKVIGLPLSTIIVVNALWYLKMFMAKYEKLSLKNN